MKKQIKIILYIMLAISLVSSILTGFARINVENNYKKVQIAIRYNDVLNIAAQMQKTPEDVFKEFKDLGVTTLFARENTVLPATRGELSNYKEQGEAIVIEGYLLQAILRNQGDIKPQFNYIVTSNKQVADTIYQNLSVKNITAKAFTLGDTTFIEIADFSNILAGIGVGFNAEDLKIAADLGYVISPQIKSWTEPSDESIDYLIKELKGIPNLGTVYFADADIPGAQSEQFTKFISENQLGYVEFFSNKQKGFNVLAKKSSTLGKDFKVVRLHTVTDEEAKKYSPQEILDRYSLALKERNLRVFLFKMNNTMHIKKDVADLKANIQAFKNEAEQKGYQITGEKANYNLKMGQYIPSVMAGLGAIIIFVLLLDWIGFAKLGYILGTIGLVGYAGLLKLSPNIGLKLMALFGAIVFPTSAILLVLDKEPRDIKQTIGAFLKICCIAFGGAITIIGTLSRTSFGLGIDVFAGVKFAHILPILLVIGMMLYKEHGLYREDIKKLLTSKVTYLTMGIIGIVAVLLLIYTMRTGNNGGVSDLELQFRQLLDNILGVRPRTKEFLIGYPILVMILSFGYKERYLPLLIFGAIGPISLVNTYAHIHTPIVVSLMRSSYGIIIGLIIGLIAIQIIKVASKVMKKWTTQTE